MGNSKRTGCWCYLADMQCNGIYHARANDVSQQQYGSPQPGGFFLGAQPVGSVHGSTWLDGHGSFYRRANFSVLSKTVKLSKLSQLKSQALECRTILANLI